MKRLVLMCMVLTMGIIAYAKNTVTTVEQVTEEVTLMDDVDYTITSDTPFGDDGIVNIVNTDHAVVIISGIKPSKVLSDGWLGYIQINGAAAVNGANCQVRMYNKGTIIFPYGSNYKPLTAYSEANLSGTVYTNFTEGHSGGYMKDVPTTCNNKIKSFVLKRGYMVTFAVGKGGWGYSRCFIADEEDLEMTSLPYALNGKITSYRIFRWNYFSKMGIAATTDNDMCDKLNAEGCYAWSVGRNMLPDTECIPDHIKENWPTAAECGSATYSCHLKGNNEPYNIEDDPKGVIETVDEMLYNWEGLMRTGMRMLSPSSWDGSDYWYGTGKSIKVLLDSVDARGWRCDVVDAHCYWTEGTFSALETYWWPNYKRPIWVTEWIWGASWNSNGCWGSGVTDDDIYNTTKRILNTLVNSTHVERFFYWNGESKGHLYENGSLTTLGEYYASLRTGLGYKKSSEYVPTNSRLISKEINTLSGAFSNSTGTVILTWDDANYERIDSFIVQVKRPSSSMYVTAGAVYPADQDGKDGANTATYTYEDEEAAIGSNTYRVMARYNGVYFFSNEISVGVSNNRHVGYLRFGDAQVSSTSATEVNFSKSFQVRKSPNVVISAPSANNSFGKFMSLQSVATGKFTAIMTPFIKDNTGESYELSGTESAAYLALPKDSTYFELPSIEDPTKKLKLQCGTVSPKVAGENVHVTFDVPYDEGVTPIVIVSAIKTSSISYGMAARVENITNTGFDVRIERQEYYSNKTFTAVNVNYFAMEPGEASLGGGLLISAQRYDDALEKGRTNGKAITLQTELVKPSIVFGAQSIQHDVLREVFIYNTTKKTVDGHSYTTAITPSAYMDATASTQNTAYSPSEDLGFIAIATNPNGSADDDPTITGIRDIIGNGNAENTLFDAWVEGNVIRSNSNAVRVYGVSGIEVGLNKPLATGLYIVTDGNASKKINIR